MRLLSHVRMLFFPGTSLTGVDEVSIQSDVDLARAVERLHKLALANNDAIRSALTISSQTSATALRSPAFWQSLQRAGKLAEAISQYQRN